MSTMLISPPAPCDCRTSALTTDLTKGRGLTRHDHRAASR